MKKRNLILFTVYVIFNIIGFTSCSKDNHNENTKETTQLVRFNVMEEGFGADTEATRTSLPNTKHDTIDLADSEVDMSIESEKIEHAKKTRAISTPTHYTIRVYKDNELKGELKGTFTSTGFTPDAGMPAYIELTRNQTYDFICFNDKVIPNGENLEVSQADVTTARIGKQQIQIGNSDKQVNLSAKHVGVRLRTLLNANKDIPMVITATLQSTGNNIPQKVSYNPSTDIYTTIEHGTMPLTTNNFPATTVPPYTENGDYRSYADYHYFLPTIDVRNLKITLTSGTIFWKPINNSVLKTTIAKWTLTANGSYALYASMSPKYTYLMNDGSTGFFKETVKGGGTKTPIALVVDPDKHIAMALRNAPGYFDGSTYHSGQPWCTKAYEARQNNTHIVWSDPNNALNADATDGYEETYNPSYSTGSIGAKATNTNFPAFYAAAHFNPGVSYIGSFNPKWYLPSYSDWIPVYSYAGFGDKTYYPSINAPHRWYGNLLYGGFYKVGGDFYESFSSFWTSTEFGYYYPTHALSIILDTRTPYFKWFIEEKNMMWTLRIRPFVKYQ